MSVRGQTTDLQTADNRQQITDKRRQQTGVRIQSTEDRIQKKAEGRRIYRIEEIE